MTGSTHRGLSRRTFLGGSLAAGGLLAAGCGPPSTANRSGILRAGIPGDVLLTSVQRFQAQNQPMRRTVFDYLLDKRADGGYDELLATGWEWDRSRTRLNITLRDGVTYHDGRPFGPDDVIASIDAALVETSGAQAAGLLKRANRVKKTGAHQLEVSFDQPFPAYLDALAMLPIIDAKTYKNVAKGKVLNGTGPFRWKKWSPGIEIELERHASYWGGKPSVEGIRYSIISDSQAMLAAVRSGDLDLANRVVPRDAVALDEDPRFAAHNGETYDIYVGANVKIKPFDDVRVRQAVAYAIDRERIADQVYRGFAKPSCVPWADETPGVTDRHRNRYTYDVDKGRSLLEQAGVVGDEVALSAYPSDPANAAIQQIVQYGLEQIGFKVRPVAYDNAQFPMHMQAGTFPGLWVANVALTTMGPVTALLTANPITPEKNTANFVPPKYRSLVNATADAATDEQQADAVGELTDYMLDQAFHNTVVQATTPDVRVTGLKGLATDFTLALDLAKARLTA